MSTVSPANASSPHSPPVGKDLLAKLRETIYHDHPVTSESLAENFQKLFKEVIKPQTFGCQSLDMFFYKIELEHGIWKTKFKNRHLIIKPSKVSFFSLSNQAPRGHI